MYENRSTFNRDTRADPRWLTNIDKTKKEIVLKAIEESGQAIVWSDTPHEPSQGADVVGSIWTNEPTRDASAFWRAYERLVAASR